MGGGTAGDGGRKGGGEGLLASPSGGMLGGGLVGGADMRASVSVSMMGGGKTIYFLFLFSTCRGVAGCAAAMISDHGMAKK
jgi:hypothetical protein